MLPTRLPTRTAAILGLLTMCTLACSHPVEDFVQSGKVDSGSPDTSRVDSSVDARPDVDASVVDTADSTADALDDSTEVGDTGPTGPSGTCTFVGGPAGAVCMPATDSFDLGAKNEAVCGAGGCATELPQVLVKLSWFWIDEHEVSVGRFRTWWNSAPRFWPSNATSYFKAGTKDLKWKGVWPSGATEPAKAAECTWLGGAVADNDDKPLNCIDWYTALAFCLSEGKSLPTEAEWEYTASAGQDRLFPWSPGGTENQPIAAGEPDCAHGLFGPTCSPFTAASSSTIWGRTRQGVWNMSGSFAEWVLDAHTATWTFASGTLDPFTDPTGTSTVPLRLARGGSYKSASAKELRAAARSSTGVSATTQDLTIGFRCVKRSL